LGSPSLCAADTYDLSGNLVKFHSRTLNRPDLLPVSKAIEFAQAHDYRALLAYCASNQIAQKLFTEIPPFVFADDFRMVKLAPEKESVELGFGPVYRFEVDKQDGRWQVSAFSTH
jgi:hypothetical protein